MRMASFGIWGTIVVCFVVTVGAHFPANEYEYSVRRQWLLDAEKKFEGKNSDLNEDETLVDHYLQYLKWAEFQATRDRFLPFLPVNQTTMVEIMESDVYKALLKLPKGGSMHTHENHEVSKSDILDMVWQSEDFKYLHVSTDEHPRGPWRLDFFTTPPKNESGWVLVNGSKYTKEEILKYQTLLGILSDYAKDNPSDSAQRWLEMNPLWGRATILLDNMRIKKEYIQRMYEKNLAEGVQYIESRKAVGATRLYRMDPDDKENNGKHYMETEENAGEREISMTQNILADFIKENPSFIGHKRITYATRRSSNKDITEKMEQAIQLHRKYPNDLIGFDLVGEEDAGNSHIFFLQNFMEIYDPKTKETKIPLYQHTGETNWPQDLITSLNDKDPMSTNQNTYEAVLLGSRRVGHGLAYYKHPYLLKLLKEKDVAIEICPISNQILGYFPDIRNHPAVEYIRSGLPVVLGTDDPGTFGIDHFNIDWYMIFMAWGLDLSDLKKISYNALKYSGMTSEEKKGATEKLTAAWSKYIDDTKKEACKIKPTSTPVVGRVLPREGAKTGGTKVHIFGRNFEHAILTMCEGKKAMCRFGDKETHAMYISNYHIVCEAPKQEVSESDSFVTVNVSLSLSGKWLETGQEFVYKHEEFTTKQPLQPTTTAGGYSKHRDVFTIVWIALCLFIYHVNPLRTENA